ncbi:YfcC family protein [Ferrimonas pelagia]|uniref:YfcC family protein n=1 Tax=Ferrimonas pelagia TaxID=1177826 RepID=A0ABP9EC00_9GAMM
MQVTQTASAPAAGAAAPKEVNHPFLSLIIMVVVALVATYLVPAGQFERVVVDGRTLVDPASFAFIESNPAGIAAFFESFYKGFVQASGIIGLVLFVGGAFGVLKYMGVLDAAVYGLTEKTAGKGLWVIAPVVMLAIYLNTTFTGMRELDVIFITLMIPICIKLGYDAMTALGIVLLSSCAGFAAALANPFFTGIAHDIAELPLYSGMWYRAIIGIFMLLTGMAYVLRYAQKVKADPSQSLVANSGVTYDVAEQVKALNSREKAAGLTFVAIMSFMIYGTLTMGFGFNQMSGCFFAAAFISGLVGGLSLNKICDYWTRGCSDVLVAALIILFARAIMTIMEDAMVVDTIIHWLSQFLIGGNELMSAVAMYVSQAIINLFIPSGSGQAVITMPIIVPLADMGGVTRQVAALASQLGDGISNYIYPTNGGLLAVLALAKIPYGTWVKFFLPLFALWTVVALVAVVIGQMIGLGPF